jgi:hypothetical protein
MDALSRELHVLTRRHEGAAMTEVWMPAKLPPPSALPCPLPRLPLFAWAILSACQWWTGCAIVFRLIAETILVRDYAPPPHFAAGPGTN